MSHFVVYNLESGAILRTGNAPENMIDLQPKGNEAVLKQSAKDDIHYVDLSSDTPVIRERSPIRPSVSTQTGEVTLSELPDPCTVSWGEQSAQATGGTATVQFDEPGTYALMLEAGAAYQSTKIEVAIL